MIVPTATDILRGVSETIHSTIEPALTGSRERSAAATVQHLLRHTLLRIEREGQILCDDIAALRTLLADLAAGLRSTWPGDTDALQLAGQIDAGLGRQHRAPGEYPTLNSLGAEAGALRELLYGCIRFLHSRPADRRAADVHAHQDAIQRYIVRQLEQEAEIIEPAFAGHGPRR